MTEDKSRANVNDRPGQAKPEPVDRQSKPIAVSSVAQPDRCAVPGRIPLFRR
jgi:hypothetical protein